MDFPRGTRLSVLAGCLATALLASACSSGGSGGSSGSGSGPEKQDIVVAAVPGEGAAGLFLAEKKGLFAKQGLHVTIKVSTSANTVIPEMLNGSVDVDSGEWSSVMGAQSAGVGKFHALANGFTLGPHVHEILAGRSSHITSPKDLRGKTIAVNELNSETTDLALSALGEYGIRASQVHFVAIPFPAMDSALASHRVGAIYEIEPYVTESEKNIGAQGVLDIDSGSTKNFPINGYMVTQQWFKRYPRTAAAFARAISQANTLATSDLSALQQIFTQSVHIPKDIADTMNVGTFPTSVDAVQLQRVINLMQRYGQLKGSLSAKQLTG